MSTLDLKTQMRKKNRGMTVQPKGPNPYRRHSYDTRWSHKVGGIQLRNHQAFDEINRNLFV